MVDGGDGGDTYNYSPPATDRLVERPDAVRVQTVEAGPVRARVLVESDYTWPARALGDDKWCTARSDETEKITVRTTLELRPGERFLRVTQELDNRCRDHRLRAHFPLPASVGFSDAECAFAVVRRGLTAEGGAHEFGLPTFPSRRFVDASDGKSGVALLHDGLLEYEVVGDGTELALTLLRSDRVLVAQRAVAASEPRGPDRPRARRTDARRTTRRVRSASSPRRLARGRLLRRGGRVHRAVGARARRRCRWDAPGERPRAARRRRRGLGGPPLTRRRAGTRLPHRADGGHGEHRTQRRPREQAGSSTSAAAPSPPSRAHVTLNPWQLATLQLA